MTVIARIVSIFIGMIVISKVYHDYKKTSMGLTVFLFWEMTWLAIIVISIYPAMISKISGLIGETDSGLTAFFAMSFVFVFFVVYKVYLKANRLEKMLGELVIKLGIRDLDDKE